MRKLATTEIEKLRTRQQRHSRINNLIVVLDNIRSAYNVGSLFRTADAFAVEQLYLCGISATPPNREVRKTAIGSTESVSWKYFASALGAIKELKSTGYEIILAEQTDESIALQDFRPAADKKYAVVFGNEVQGVGDELLPLADAAVEIPQFGMKHSFNITVAAGIVLWHFETGSVKKQG